MDYRYWVESRTAKDPTWQDLFKFQDREMALTRCAAVALDNITPGTEFRVRNVTSGAIHMHKRLCQK